MQCSSHSKVEKIYEDGLDLIPSPSPSVKIQIIGGKVYLRYIIRQNIAIRGGTGCCQQTYCFQKFVDNTQQCLPLKFGISEKGTKFQKIFHLKFDVTK